MIFKAVFELWGVEHAGALKGVARALLQGVSWIQRGVHIWLEISELMAKGSSTCPSRITGCISLSERIDLKCLHDSRYVAWLRIIVLLSGLLAD